MNYATYLNQVLANHPMAFQANMQPDAGAAKLKAAKGNFDPKLKGTWDQKTFDGKNYFRTLNTGVSLPTRLGVTVNGKYRRADGEFLNPELTGPQSGLFETGLELDIGR